MYSIDEYQEMKTMTIRGNEIVNGQAVRCYFNPGAGCLTTVVYMDQPEHEPRTFRSIDSNRHGTARCGRHLGRRVLFALIPSYLKQAVEDDLSEAAITRTA